MKTFSAFIREATGVNSHTLHSMAQRHGYKLANKTTSLSLNGDHYDTHTYKHPDGKSTIHIDARHKDGNDAKFQFTDKNGAKYGKGSSALKNHIQAHQASHAIKEAQDYYVGARHFSDMESAKSYAKKIHGVVTPTANPDHKGFKPKDLKKGKLFPQIGDSPDDNHHRMVHSLTHYDLQQQHKPGHNPYALGHYMKAAQDATAKIKKGMNPAQAINQHFSGRLADRLHNHLDTGGKGETKGSL